MWEHITEVVQRLRPDPSPSNGSSMESEEELVQYEGMLISAAAAQRRRSALSFCFAVPAHKAYILLRELHGPQIVGLQS